MYVVAVHIDVKPGQLDSFLPHMTRQAENSVALEKGCRSFDVSVSGDGARVFLYETYDNAQDFESHLTSAHFLAFKAATAELIDRLDIHRFALLHRV